MSNSHSDVEARVMQPFYSSNGITIYNENFNSVLPFLEAPNAIITDPPYPDYHKDKWEYQPPLFLNNYNCRQLIFWSAAQEFPLDYTAVHIWDKKINGAASAEYERIFERNGQKICRLFNHYFINSTVAANYGRDVFTGHVSQKPIKLMMELVKKFTEVGHIILDPFMGSGSTLVAAKKLGRRAIGIEINKHWCEVAVKRLSQMELFG